MSHMTTAIYQTGDVVSIRLVRRSCHAGAVANVDFKLCRVWRTVTGRSSEAELEQKGRTFFKPTGKGAKWTNVLYVGGENWARDTNYGEKTASRSRSFETALSSHRKLRHTTQKPTKTMKQAK